MKRIGIIGGLGPESTIEYYRGIIDRFRQSPDGSTYPELILYSMDMTQLMRMMEDGQWDSLVEWLVNAVRSLHRAGAEFVSIASNTPHIVFDAVQSKSPIPMLSIVEATRSRANRMGVKRVGLLGTKFTMQSDFFQKVFAENDVLVIVPKPDEQQTIHDKLMTEVELGIIKDSTRQQFLDIAQRMIKEDSIEALILGCTELPLILDKSEYGVPVLNTTSIHIDSIVRYCRSGEGEP